jgi:sugar diacid utilization regulator
VLCHREYFLKEIHPELIEVCDALDVPLIVVPPTVTYIEILVPIVNKILEIGNEKNRLALEVQEELLRKVVNEEGLDSISRFLGEKIGSVVVIIDVMDKVVTSYRGDEREVDSIREALQHSRDHFLSDDIYLTLNLAKDYYVYPIVNEENRYGYLVCEINKLDQEYVLLLLKHTAVACSLLVTQRQRRSRMDQMYRNELIKELVEGTFHTSADLEKLALGIHWKLEDIDRLLLMEISPAKITAEGGDLSQGEVLRTIDHLCIQNELPREFGLIQGRFLLFLERGTDGFQTAGILKERILLYLRKLRPEEVSIAISSPIRGPGDIPEVYKTAMDTLVLGKRFLPMEQVYDCDRLAFLPSLYENAGEKDFQKIARRILAPLLEYDLEHNHELVKTLEALLLHDNNMQGIADALYIHRNTLQYRRKKIVELLGEDPFAGLNRINYLLAVFTIKF